MIFLQSSDIKDAISAHIPSSVHEEVPTSSGAIPTTTYDEVPTSSGAIPTTTHVEVPISSGAASTTTNEIPAITQTVLTTTHDAVPTRTQDVPSTHPTKARRHHFTHPQVQILEQYFSRRQYLGPGDMDDLAERLGLQKKKIKTWFQNRRYN